MGIMGSVAFDNIFNADRTPLCGERVWGERLGQYIGGMAANQAMEAARYCSVLLIGKVGSDPEGEDLRSELEARGVGTQALLIDDAKSTGQTYMFLVGDEYFSVVTPGANQNLQPAEILSAVESLRGGTLMASLEVNVEVVTAALRHARSLDIATVLIPSPPEVCTPELLDLAETLIVNRREARLLLGLEIATLEKAANSPGSTRLPHQKLVVTLGGEGAVLYQDGTLYSAPALPVQVVDPVGAGDAFAGAFVGAHLLGFSPLQVLATGCIAGSLAVSTLNGQATKRGIHEVEALFKAHYSTICDWPEDASRYAVSRGDLA